MGITGSGKSFLRMFALVSTQERSRNEQFIKLITGDKGIKIGHLILVSITGWHRITAWLHSLTPQALMIPTKLPTPIFWT